MSEIQQFEAGIYEEQPQGVDVVPTDPFVGKTVGNCQLLERMNEGGTALIYRAHNVRFDLDRVVKILKPSLIDEQDFHERFQQEAQLVARFDHPNILRVFDTGQASGHIYIEMEHIAGQTLREYIQATPRINERELLSIASQLVSALEYAHNLVITGPANEEIKGVLHRDIKPENIMITPGKLVKLMDFGAAKALNITHNTMQGMIVGTFHYMSPEQLSGGTLDARSDFFSLGIVLYELATGKRPFLAENLTDLIDKIKSCHYKRVRQLRPSISPLTEELIDRLLSRNVKHRPSTANEIAENLQHCIHSYTAFGTSKKVLIPFSLRRHFSVIAVGMSSAALVLSTLSFMRSVNGISAPPQFSESASIPLLEQGRILERKEQWNDAVGSYRMVPSIEKGGLANEYLEAQVRMAAIMIKYQNQYNKARKVLESLRARYSDPAIDAYLGRCYYHLGLYSEAQQRLANALKSNAGSIMPQAPELKKEILYYSAASIDARFQKEESNQALLVEAIKSWDFYLEFAGCSRKNAGSECRKAQRRRKELALLMKK